MKTYIGTKVINAEIVDQGEPDRDKQQDGYKVIYEGGYGSWSPRDVFEAAYQPLDAMNFGHAVHFLKLGKKVTRAGWNGSGMFVYLVPAASYPVQTGAAASHFGEGSMVPYRSYLALKTAQGDVATWVPSCSDVLAEDWAVVE